MNNNNFVDMGDEINEFEETINKPKNDNINEPKFPLYPKDANIFLKGVLIRLFRIPRHFLG